MLIQASAERVRAGAIRCRARFEQEPAIASAVLSPAAQHVTSAGPSGEDIGAAGPNRSGKRRARAAVPRSKRLDLRVSEEELAELRRLAGRRGISIQRMLVDDALTGRRADMGWGATDSVAVDDLVGELMRLRGEIGRAGNVANQAVRDARRLDPRTRKELRLREAMETVRELAALAAGVRHLATKVGRLR